MKYEQSTAASISEQEKTFRTYISNDPALSHFLETGATQQNARFAKEAIYRDLTFLAFISPYFHEVYVNAVINAFDQRETSLMSDIAMNTILLDDTHRKQAFHDILVYLEQKEAMLASFHAKLLMQEFVDIPALTEHTNMTTIANLNYLPGEFLEFRCAYARAIMKVINSLVNRNLQIATIMITDLRQLTVDMQTANDVKALYQRLNDADQEASAIDSSYGYSGTYDNSGSSGYSGSAGYSGNFDNSGGSDGSIGRVLLGIVIIIAIIIITIFGRFSSGNSGYHSSGSYHYHRSYRPSYHPSDHPSYHPSYRRGRR
ncbi:hypothetical protein [Chitinophaga ginsengisoli]|uniref:Uncharacterized protein n=1 Tax=Chitinophaga ginsengisoli TaxID=363837 RepID=A0A2P8FPY7_9BACT|nr:hypothetical protein [Chitinophaga ginsengisoli]PSL23796.1 hypothetical protein CLV42_117154 [Chitinophaga ginsengisoli]